MIIVVEGADRTGKTTLCAQLHDRLNYPVFKQALTPLRGQNVADSQTADDAVMQVLESTVPDVVFDRYFPSEYAYGKAFDRTFDLSRILELDARLSHLPHLCVLLSPSFEDDPEMTARGTERVEEEYNRFIAVSRCTWMHLTGSIVGERLELIMRKITARRPDEHHVFMRIAHEVARRSTCLSRRNGSVLVSAEGHVIATGYNGPPAKMGHPTHCPRLTRGVASGEGLELCNDVHAEENCVAQAAKQGHAVKGGKLYTVMSPCHRCWRMLVNAGITEVVYEREYGDVRALDLPSTMKIRRLT